MFVHLSISSPDKLRLNIRPHLVSHLLIGAWNKSLPSWTAICDGWLLTRFQHAKPSVAIGTTSGMEASKSHPFPGIDLLVMATLLA
jgi:hypothetical protein